MIILSQRDPRWSSVKMSPSNLTLGRFGCTTTCISMLSDYFNCFTLPSVAIDHNIKYTKDGLIRWETINFPNFTFEKRVRINDPSVINESLNNPKKACILTIDRDAHWVVALKSLGDFYWIADPWDGKKRLLNKRRVSGSAHFIQK